MLNVIWHINFFLTRNYQEEYARWKFQNYFLCLYQWNENVQNVVKIIQMILTGQLVSGNTCHVKTRVTVHQVQSISEE